MRSKLKPDSWSGIARTNAQVSDLQYSVTPSYSLDSFGLQWCSNWREDWANQHNAWVKAKHYQLQTQ